MLVPRTWSGQKITKRQNKKWKMENHVKNVFLIFWFCIFPVFFKKYFENGDKKRVITVVFCLKSFTILLMGFFLKSNVLFHWTNEFFSNAFFIKPMGFFLKSNAFYHQIDEFFSNAFAIRLMGFLLNAFAIELMCFL